MFRYIILGLLRNGEASYGYALTKEYFERSGLNVSTGNFYRELQRMVGEGLLRPLPKPGDVDPRRTPYEITEAGIAAFDAWLLDDVPNVNSWHDDEISARALFLAETDDEAAVRTLESWRRQLWASSKVLEGLRQAAVRKAGESPDRFAVLPHLLARRLKHLTAHLEFIEDLRGAMRHHAERRKSELEPSARTATGRRAGRARSALLPPVNARR